ncbi:fluoride efflux transporter CrcB [Adhaeribacter soli]|uniref:Fluoride-specific ion channel FluC n=1 Tax=Adhaeribacter soli TaxID=2607655 RepID=A0A5N1JAE8_9BACT|nr:fluoride efflux transporter CrcB [Adhaeribacter soli]KAA9345988.1 fluoride efflux transporter CrcB [Adhaeribacter soli]
MKELFLIFVGGGLGSVVRYILGRWLNAGHQYAFPVGTFTVNVLACLILGLVIGMAEQKLQISPLTRLFWAVGFCGGFSTFSTFSYENLLMLQTNQNSLLLGYILLSLVLCVSATFGGQLLATRFF